MWLPIFLAPQTPPSLSASLGKECGSFTLLNFCMKFFYVTYSGATTSPWSSSSCSGGSLESVGNMRCCSSAEEAKLKFVESKGCSVWNFFFKCWFSKRGTNKAKKPPQSLPALLQRPFLGRAGPWPHLQQNNWPEPGTFDCASVVDPLQCSWEPPA